MDDSGAAYASDQLGSGWAAPQEVSQFEGIYETSDSQSISNFLVRGNQNPLTQSTIIAHRHESLSTFAAAQVSAELTPDDRYLSSLVKDNEIQQIRSGNQIVLSRLLSLYVFEDSTRVRAFLEDHPSTSGLLLEAVKFLRESFGNEVVLQLQVPADEEIPLTIGAVALWDGKLEDARAALKKFDDAWWTPNCHRASGRVIFDYQLV